MTELSLLRVLLILSLAVAPFTTHRAFLEPSRFRDAAQGVAWLSVVVGLLVPVPLLCTVWLVFCAVSFAQFLWVRCAHLRSPRELAKCVPFMFSIIAAVWLVGGANDLRILGYGPAFSYYAALHGTVLGWMLVGALAVLANQDRPYRHLYVASVFVCLASFLLIAIGIDSVRALKPIGVVGLSLAIPASQLAFLRDVWSRDRTAFVLGAASLAVLVFTMVLAWRNELSMPALTAVGDVRSMVSIHGVLNALVVAPLFVWAVARRS